MLFARGQLTSKTRSTEWPLGMLMSAFLESYLLLLCGQTRKIHNSFASYNIPKDDQEFYLVTTYNMNIRRDLLCHLNFNFIYSMLHVGLTISPESKSSQTVQYKKLTNFQKLSNRIGYGTRIHRFKSNFFISCVVLGKILYIYRL